MKDAASKFHPKDAAIPGQPLPAQMIAISSVCCHVQTDKSDKRGLVPKGKRQNVQTICPVGLGQPVSRQLHDDRQPQINKGIMGQNGNGTI